MKRFFILFIFSFFTFFISVSNAILIERKNNRIIISDQSCEKINLAIDSLKSWLENSQNKKGCHINAVPGKRNCEMDVTDCLPDHVAKHHGTNAKESGPNCFNLVLVLQGILPYLRHSPREELSYYLSSGLCRILTIDEARRSGDIGIIKNRHWLDHAFIYINEDITYSKNGYEEIKPYALQSYPEMLEKYFGTQPSFYRCISMDEYLAKSIATPEQLTNTQRTLSEFEFCLQKNTFEKILIPKEFTSNFSDTIKALNIYAETELKNAKDAETLFILGSIKMRLAGISAQLSYLGDYTKYVIELEELREVFDKSASRLK